MKTFYHATTPENIPSILENGLLAGSMGCIFMTEREDEAVRFLAIRFIPKIITLKIELDEEDMEKVHETFDHSPTFFQCRAFGYFGNISKEKIEPSKVYEP